MLHSCLYCVSKHSYIMINLKYSKYDLASFQSSGDGGNMCLELALEGERLCKAGDCRAGVAFFQAAIQAGTDDLRTLSAIYSQLGNAYFYLGDYVKAMQYHKHDLTLARFVCCNRFCPCLHGVRC